MFIVPLNQSYLRSVSQYLEHTACRLCIVLLIMSWCLQLGDKELSLPSEPIDPDVANANIVPDPDYDMPNDEDVAWYVWRAECLCHSSIRLN